MWLFDDILKKPTPTNSGDPLSNMGASGMGGGTSSGGNPPTDDTTPPIIIQKSEETSLFGAETPVTTLPVPPVAPVTPSGADSLIIVSEEMTPIETQAPIFAEPMITQTEDISIAAPLDAAPTVTPEIPTTPMNDSLFGNLTSNQTEVMTETPAPTGGEVSQSETPINSLFDTIEPTPEVTIVSDMPVEASLAEETSGTLFATSLTENIPQEAFQEVKETPVTAEPTVFFHPSDFIQKSITDIDAMIGKIDEKHEAKISEAEGYKAEKKRYTELEKTAYAEAVVMDEEKEHALHMRKLLVSELPENKGSHIETSLTGIAVANTVEKTMEKPHHHVKAKVAA